MSGVRPTDGVRIEKESIVDPKLVEADSSTNSGEANSASETTRQSSLQRIQMRKEKVKIVVARRSFYI